jgi:hypothetical protein
MTTNKEPKDARQGAGQYPNYWSYKSPSGHTVIIDDTKDKEHLTIQHRTGSIIQMHPDGNIVIRSSADKYETIFGKNVVTITGDYDICVNGGASLKVEGDYDLTISGNMHTTVKGNIETLCNGNMNYLIKGNMDMAIDGSQTVKTTGNVEQTTEGKHYIAGDDGLRLESTNAAVDVKAEANVNIDAGQDLAETAQGDATRTAQGNVEDVGEEIHHNH